jgi:thiol-disulfide isomerase/thioredoxin
MRLAQQRAERRRRLLTIGGSAVAIIAVVLVIVFVGINGSNKKVSDPNALRQSFTTAENAALKAPTVDSMASAATPANVIATYLPQTITDQPLTSSGKPEVLYVGAEFCPYCAAERWALAVALDKFGALSGLETMHSSPSDTDPNTPTMTFLHSSWSSQSVDFTPVEVEDINHANLQTPTSAENAVWSKYTQHSFPFIDFGGKSVIVGPTLDPANLAGLSQAQVTTDLKDPSSKVSQSILGAAGYMTAAICQMTNNQPASVCTASVQKLTSQFKPFTAPSSGGSSS